MKKIKFLKLIIISILLIFFTTTLASNDTRGIKAIKDLSHSSGKLGAYRALIIGINDYEDPKIPDLETAVNDAKAMTEILQSRYGFQVNLLLNKNATRGVIYRALRKLAISTKPDDSVLIYFAGHGDLDRTYEDGWWIPVDAKGGNPETYLDNVQVQKAMRSMAARHVLLISDSCYSGTLFGQTRGLTKAINDRYYLNLYNEKSRWGMTSGNKTPVSDQGTKGHSVFAYQLLKELRNNERKYISTQELYTRIAPIISNNSEQTPLCRPIRNTGDQGGEFIFIASGGVTSAPIKTENGLSLERQRLEQERKELEKIRAELDERKRVEAERKRIEAEKKNLLEKEVPKIASISPPVTDSMVIARDGHYVKYANNVVHDKRTDLEWLVGPDQRTTWFEAKAWVESLNIDGGWRMPSRKELRTLFWRGKGPKNLTSLIEISELRVWSGELAGQNKREAWFFFFDGGGGENWTSLTSTDTRAIAVRFRKEAPKVALIAPATMDAKVVAQDGRYVAYDNGTVKDTQTGLMWASKDNGEDINWEDAKKYCENYRGGGYTDWRMPTQDELAGLYDKSKSYQAKPRRYDVHLTKLIQLTTCCPWASEIRSSKAAFFYFNDGSRFWNYRYNSVRARALPVRDNF